MAWKIELDVLAKKDLSKFDNQVSVRILKFLNERLATSANPRLLGENLKGKFHEYWKYRVGDYRIICSILDDTLTVMVVRIGDRKDVYRRS